MNTVKMMFTLVWILIASSVAATDVGPGVVSGTWTLAGSPYIVQGDITVTDQEILTIEPGVSVLFDGPYVLYVDGQLQAVGTVVDSILFSRNAGRTDWGHIELDSASDPGSTFQYCRIEYGNATQLEAPHTKNGGGIYSDYGSSLSIMNCAVEDCRAEDGGGIYISGSGVVQNSAIRRCSAEGSNQFGGGAWLGFGADLIDSEVSGNNATFVGGGVNADISTGSITGCAIFDNHVNAGHGGGLAFSTSWGDVSYNCFYGNTIGESGYSDGGGVYFWNSNLGTFSHNTIVGNYAPEGSGIAFGYTSILLEHCIVAFNNGDASYDISGSAMSFDTFCSFGNTGSDALVGTATNTVNEHPLFCDYGAADFTLCSDSPCLPDGIGAEGQGCGNCWPAVESSTWSRIKTLY